MAVPCWAPLPCLAEPAAPELWHAAWGGIPPWAGEDIGAAEVLANTLPLVACQNRSVSSFLPCAHRRAGLSQPPCLGPGVTCVPVAPPMESFSWILFPSGKKKKGVCHSVTALRQCLHFGGILEGMRRVPTSPLGSPGVLPGSLLPALPAVWHGWPEGAAGLSDAQTFQPACCRLLP